MDWQVAWHRFGKNLVIQIKLKLTSCGMQDNCAKQGLQPLPAFIEKIIQLYEMIVVRHGLMLVGQSFGMKTAAHSVLAAALSDLHEKVSILQPCNLQLDTTQNRCRGCCTICRSD